MNLEPITESSLIQLRSMEDWQAAVALDTRLRDLESLWRRSFVERGLILIEMKQRLLWQFLSDPVTGQPYTSFERWVLTAAPQSRSDCYAAMRAVEELWDIRDELEQVPRCNVTVLQALSSKVRETPEILEAARTLSQREFVLLLERDHPEEHIETISVMHLAPVKSASVVIEKAIRRAMAIEGLTTREQVLEFWASAYLIEHPE